MRAVGPGQRGGYGQAGRTGRRANVVEHERGAVVQLQAEPIPPQRITAQRTGAILMVHPTVAGDLDRTGGCRDCAGSLQPGQAVVVGGVACLGPLLVQPLLTLEHGRARLAQRQVNRHGAIGVLCAGHNLHNAWCSCAHRPILKPHAIGGFALRTCQAGRAAAEALKAVVDARRAIRHGEVRHVDLVARQCRGARNGLGGERTAKNGELEAIICARGALQVARVVPPFGAIGRVGAVVEREREGHRRQRTRITRVMRHAQRLHHIGSQ